MLVAGVTYGFLVLWTFFAPPNYVAQLVSTCFLRRMKAFVMEGRNVASVRDYVTRDFFERLKLSPEQMAGRRVLSNPPGMTVASIVVERFVEQSGWLRARWWTGSVCPNWTMPHTGVVRVGAGFRNSVDAAVGRIAARGVQVLPTLAFAPAVDGGRVCLRVQSCHGELLPGQGFRTGVDRLADRDDVDGGVRAEEKTPGIRLRGGACGGDDDRIDSCLGFSDRFRGDVVGRGPLGGASFWMTRCALPSLLGATVAMAVARVAAGLEHPVDGVSRGSAVRGRFSCRSSQIRSVGHCLVSPCSFCLSGPRRGG